VQGVGRRHTVLVRKRSRNAVVPKLLMSTGLPRRAILLSPMLALSRIAFDGSKSKPLASGADRLKRSTIAGVSGPTGIPGSWTAVFDDEFVGNRLNSKLWNTQYPWGADNNGDGSENCYLPKNVALDGTGHLRLTGRKGTEIGRGSNGKEKSWPYSSGQVRA
jgi:hypothetical protein